MMNNQQCNDMEKKLQKEMEGMDEDERLEYINKLSTSVFNEIIEKKNGEPSKWQSYWEQDENDIEHWSKQDILRDPVKGLLTAVEQGNLLHVQQYINQDRSLLNACDSDGYTALHRSANGNQLKICEYLLESGVDIHALTNDKWNALHCAAFWNNYEIGSLLLQNGIDINAQTNGGQTPLHLAASQNNNRQIIQLLLMHPFINVNIQNKLNETPITIAKRSSSVHCLFDLYTDALMKLK
ncbi:unnamed protein product [Rotaria sordida]|uniref:Uncharacterized protein n=1 Tax=Rotaria sordida TaxID=392033 RepID=A0A818RQL1_9BILA|nr:unnamed protein product [Rotaria sordida]CAF1150697.1 unnamed protein product [Rotaria sordida]CAF1394415.1 unnamed protein product [Rotaria sordida]CAF3654348.1 unnamed protein product [Rotaria sordida]